MYVLNISHVARQVVSEALAKAPEHSTVIMLLKSCYLYEKRAVCPSVLLRVPRASRSSLTSAQHPGKPLFWLYPNVHKAFCLATGMACMPKRSQGGAQRAEDMSAGRCAVAAARLDARNAASSQHTH